MTQPEPPAAPPIASPTAPPVVHPRAPEPTMDALFGRFWPETGVSGSARAVLAALAVGVLAAVVFPDRGLGIGTFLVLLAAGGAVLAAAVRPWTPFTLACSALCVPLAATTFVRDAEWIVVLCVLAGAAVFVAGLVNGRTLQGFVLGWVAWPLAGLRCLPWFGRSLQPVAGARAQRGRAAHRRAVRAGGARVRPAVRLGGRAVRRVGRRPGPRPPGRHVRGPGLPDGVRRRRRARGVVPRPQPAGGRARRRPDPARWPSATSGWSPSCSSTPSSSCSSSRRPP